MLRERQLELLSRECVYYGSKKWCPHTRNRLSTLNKRKYPQVYTFLHLVRSVDRDKGRDRARIIINSTLCAVSFPLKYRKRFLGGRFALNGKASNCLSVMKNSKELLNRRASLCPLNRFGYFFDKKYRTNREVGNDIRFSPLEEQQLLVLASLVRLSMDSLIQSARNQSVRHQRGAGESELCHIFRGRFLFRVFYQN